MSPERAKEILLLYRPGSADDADPEMVEAIAAARSDGPLREWFEQHCQFQTAVRAKLRSIEPPAGLRDAILARGKIIPFPAWRRTAWFAAAAAVILLLAIAGGQWWRSGNEDQFSKFQLRMVGASLREYRMDIVSSNMTEVRRYLAASGAPSDYELTDGLSRLRLTGGGRLTWRSHPVAMVCFNRGDGQMLFLYVMDEQALANPPPDAPVGLKLNSMATGSWTKSGKAYFLVGPDEETFLRKYF